MSINRYYNTLINRYIGILVYKFFDILLYRYYNCRYFGCWIFRHTDIQIWQYKRHFLYKNCAQIYHILFFNSMAARVGTETVKAPGALVVSTYAPCFDVRKVVTPDLKAPSMGKSGVLLFVDLSGGYCRLGGSALAQVFKQLGK